MSIDKPIVPLSKLSTSIDPGTVSRNKRDRKQKRQSPKTMLPTDEDIVEFSETVAAEGGEGTAAVSDDESESNNHIDVKG